MMGADTEIEWCDDSVSFWWGCTQISPGCDNCYAKRMAKRLKDWEWNGAVLEIKGAPKTLQAINRKAGREGRNRFVFINSMSDTFDNQAPPALRAALFDAIANAPNIIALVLTKRVGNVDGMTLREVLRWPPNAWLGATVVNQEEADRDIPKLLAAKAALQIPRVFLSVEPMLGPVELTRMLWPAEHLTHIDSLTGRRVHGVDTLGVIAPQIDWVICGGESGANARPMHPDWARSLRDQCAAAGVPFHFKQWGEWGPNYSRGIQSQCFRPDGSRYNPKEPDGWTEAKMQSVYRVGKQSAGRLLDGVEHNGRPQP